MNTKQTNRNQTNAAVSIEDISQNQKNCPVSEQGLRDGAAVVAYAVRSCPHAPWLVHQLRCPWHPPSLSSLSTLGVTEVVLEGRVGRVVDTGLQRDWVTVVDPEVVAWSPAHTRDSFNAEPREWSSPGCAACELVAAEGGEA
jgi:hypothetical protein